MSSTLIRAERPLFEGCDWEFGTIQRCYDEWRPPAGSPLTTWQDAFQTTEREAGEAFRAAECLIWTWTRRAPECLTALARASATAK